MRNAFLIGASVFALGIGSAVADQSTTINDTSEGSVNIINQSASDTLSTITVTQTGEAEDAPGTVNAAPGVNVHIDQVSDDDSMVDVVQDGAGDGNSIYVDQDALGGPSSVMASQMGEANQGDLIQGAADSHIGLHQDGEANMAMVNQTADETMAEIGQWGESNSASISQMASENTASVNQWGEMNSASVLQDGETNDADVVQGADGAPVEMNVAEVIQSGTESFVVVSQLGSENFASATQNSGVSDGATITINQDGMGGSTTIIQN